MCRHRFVVWTAFLGLAACIALACGGNRKIESITVRPSSADARNYPGGEVPFVATGHYNMAPMTVTPLQANWGVASLQIVNDIPILGPANGAASVDANGVAHCAANTSGTYSIAAWVNLPYSGPPPRCPLSWYNNMSCPNIAGTAQFTCP